MIVLQNCIILDHCSNEQREWISKIIGIDESGILQRFFLKPKKKYSLKSNDYTEAIYENLEEGYYEIYDPCSQEEEKRFFIYLFFKDNEWYYTKVSKREVREAFQK